MDTGKIVLIVCLLMASFIFAKAVTGNKSQSKQDNNEETYTVIETNDNFEIREYNSAIVARVDLGSGDYGTVSNKGFRKLANYIFGGNQESEQIAMTSPVMMELGESASMSFFMPAEYELEGLPQPNSGEVLLEEMKPIRVAVIKFGGWANQQKIDSYQEKLVALLEAEKISHKGKFYFLGYNSPYEMTNRLNEVIVEL